MTQRCILLSICSMAITKKAPLNEGRTATTIRFPDELLEEIVAAANEREQSVNGFVIVEMREVMARRKAERQGVPVEKKVRR